MAESTTVRVRVSTRERLRALAEEEGSTLEAMIRHGLDLIERERRLQRGEADARRVAADPEDRAEVERAIRDLVGP